MIASLDRAQPNTPSLAGDPLRVVQRASEIDHASNLESASSAAFHFATEALAQLGTPALVFDQARRILAANNLMGRLSALIRLRAQNTLTFNDPAAEILFRRSAADLDNVSHSHMRSFVVRCSSGDATIARILPIRPPPGAASGPRAGMLLFFALDQRGGPSAALLQTLFAMTPAEARVARGLAAGNTINELASAARVSRNTVRSQVRGILEKTGCNRQSEAVSLFCRIESASWTDSQSAFA